MPCDLSLLIACVYEYDPTTLQNSVCCVCRPKSFSCMQTNGMVFTTPNCIHGSFLITFFFYKNHMRIVKEKGNSISKH